MTKTKAFINKDREQMMVQVRKMEKDEICQYEIGSLNADLTNEYLDQNKEFQKHLAAFALNLARQMKVDAIILHSIEFQRVNFVKR